MYTLLLSAILSAPFCGSDTIVHAIKPDSVVIIETNRDTQVKIFGKEDQPGYTFTYTRSGVENAETHLDEHTVPWDFNLPILRKDKRPRTPYGHSTPTINVIDRIHLGLSLPLAPTSDAHTHAGWNIGFDVANVEFDLSSRKDAFFAGLGIECNTLFASKSWRWTKHNDELTTIPYKEGAHKRFSRWATAALTLPVRYSHAFNNDLCIDFSVEPQWTFSNTISTRYTIGHRSYKDTSRHAGSNHFNLAFGLALRSERAIGIYLKYQPFNALSSTSPANFKMLTVGFVL